MRLLTMATDNPLGFELLCEHLDEMFYSVKAVNRGEWQAQKTDAMATRELNHVVLELPIPEGLVPLTEMVHPNMPWAEEHFLERVGGDPTNPPPSAKRWPFAKNGHKEHTDAGKFSHTYPERFWPRWAGEGYEGMDESKAVTWEPMRGVRYDYGDLATLLHLLVSNPMSRQLYLPVWFPEDLQAAQEGQRVPCTIGYHFLKTDDGLDCTYHIRSCDYMRHFRDDVYMAMRLTQWLCDKFNHTPSIGGWLPPSKLYMHISNFHTFVGDDDALAARVKEYVPGITIQGGDQ